MKMRNLSLAAAVLLLSASSQAQDSGVQLRAGVNLANVSVTPNGRVDDANGLTSFQVGILGNIPLGTSVLSLQPGLLFTGKGSKIQEGDPSSSGRWYRQTNNPFYLEVPVNLLLRAPLGSSTRIFVGAGPYVAMGIAGKSKTEGRNLLGVTYNSERDIEFSNDDPTTLDEEEGTGFNILRRFDYGVNGTAGIETKGVVLGVNYGLGLAKLQSGANSGADDANKHRVLSLTLGFKL